MKGNAVELRSESPGSAINRLMRTDNDRRLARLRSHGVGFALLTAFTAVCLTIPIPKSSGTILNLILVGASSATGTMFIGACASQYRREPLSEIVAMLLGKNWGIRSAERFLRRLRHECNRAQRGNSDVFSVLVIAPRAPLPATDAMRVRFMRSIRLAVRTDDVVGDSGEKEVWVLLSGADEDGTAKALRRLRVRLGSEHGVAPAGGAATFGVDGRTADSLVTAARRLSELDAYPAFAPRAAA